MDMGREAMTLNFYVSYLVPVKPEKIQKIEQEISRIESSLENSINVDPSTDRKEADMALTRLRAQMEPERRREPAIMRSHVGPEGRVFNWDCPRCGSCEGLTHVVASVRNGEISMRSSCHECGAEVHKEELPMSLDLFRMRTRRTDGVEVQAKP